MFNPCPKPQHIKRPPKKMKQGRGNPFPQKIKNEITQRDEGKCQHPGCNQRGFDHHHLRLKGMGSSFLWWIHDTRNGVLLCTLHHIPYAHNKTFWKLFWEAWGVVKFGWSGGQDITLDEWLDKNEYRLKKANVDVDKLVNQLQG